MKNELFILWTNDNAVTSEKMVFLYAGNAKVKVWFDSVTLIIWGATAVLAAENSDVEMKIRKLADAGVEISACKACADQLGVTEKLISMGVEVRYWGEDLSNIIREKRNLLTV
jgi:hypothetical protein